VIDGGDELDDLARRALDGGIDPFSAADVLLSGLE